MIADRLRKAVLQAAMEGKLTKQLDNDSSVYQLITEVHKIDNDYLWEIPKTWAWVKFGDLVDFKMGKTPERANPIYWGNDVPWISIADMNNQSLIMETKEKVSNSALESIFKEQISPKGTLIMSFKLTVGRTSILGIDALHNEAIISIFPKKEPDTQKKYLYFVLPEIANMGETKDAIKGKTLNSKSIYNLLIPLPPIEEQKRIVEKLEVLLAEINKLEEDEKALKEFEDKFPEKLKNAIIQAAIQGKLVDNSTKESSFNELDEKTQTLYMSNKDKYKLPFDIPNSWILMPIFQRYEFVKTGVQRYQGTKDYYSTGSVQAEGNVPIGKYTFDGRPSRANRLVKTGDIIEAKMANTVKATIIDETMDSQLVSTGFFQLRIKNEITRKYVYFYLQSPQFIKDKNDLSTGTTQIAINDTNLRKIMISIPPLKEQEIIVNKIEELLPVVIKLEEIIS